MSEGLSAVRRIAWMEVAPWLILFRTFRLAVSLPLLSLATIGVLLTPVGWKISAAAFAPQDGTDEAFVADVAANGQWPDRVGAFRPAQLTLEGAASWCSESGWQCLKAGVPAVYLRFVEPVAQLARLDLSFSAMAYYLFGSVWNLVIWSFLGGAISRVAAVQLGREERLSLGKALGHARRCYFWYLAAPFFPLLGVFLLTLPIMLLGLSMRTSVGVLLAGFLWPLVLVAAVVIAVLLIGLSLGWPLMWPTISSEESSDPFEAFSRSYSYTFQRPLHYLFFALVTVLLGFIGWMFVVAFGELVIGSAHWAAAWGAGSAHLAEMLSPDRSGLEWFGGSLIRWATLAVRTVTVAFNYSFFFCAASGIYLLLRLEVDQTEMDEVFSEDEEQRFGLADLQTDGAGTTPSASDS